MTQSIGLSLHETEHRTNIKTNWFVNSGFPLHRMDGRRPGCFNALISALPLTVPFMKKPPRPLGTSPKEGNTYICFSK